MRMARSWCPARPSSSSVTAQLRNLCKATGARSTVIPFSSFHQYQREDHSGPNLHHAVRCLPLWTRHQTWNASRPFPRWIASPARVETQHHDTVIVTPRPATDFGDNWSDQLEPADIRAIETYFAHKERVRRHFGFVTFKVGGREHSIRMDGRPDRGITFEVPRGSLMSAVDYRIFDDLLIGNFNEDDATRTGVAQRAAG